MVIFYLLRKLFAGFKANLVFAKESVRTIRQIGYTYLIWCALLPFHEALMTFVLTFNNPDGERFIRVSLSDYNIEQIVTALLVIVIAWVMEEAHKLKEQEVLTI